MKLSPTEVGKPKFSLTANMDRKEIKLAARLGAIEYMIAELFKKIYAMSDTHYKDVEKEHEFLRKYLRKMTLSISDPVLSDLTAGEMMDAFEKLLENIEIAVRR
jgi:hypothetical protein